MAWKKTKRFFKNKEHSDPFLRTVKILAQTSDFVEFKMRLDTGCEIHNLITLHAVQKLAMIHEVVLRNESICTCLNGEQLVSMGTLVLCWKGKSFRKIFNTPFHVIGDESLPWDVILGAETIHEHGILNFAGFGGASIVLPKKTKEEKSRAAERKLKHEEKAAANDAKVDAHKKAQEEASRKFQANDKNSSSGSSGQSRD